LPVSQFGQINTSALLVPNVYVQIQPPSNQFINGVPTNILGVIGTATWGPVNSPVVVGTVAQGTAVFGPAQARKYDLMTPVNTASLQGANFMKCVRVTDGTDTAAAITVLSNCIVFTSKYTGSFGGGITVTLSAGSKASTQKVVVGAPGLVPEVFDNIGAGLNGNALWVAIAAAVNTGSSIIRGPSQIITAAAGAGTTTPAAATYNLVGGTDGVSTITGATLVGADTLPRAGMYALRNSQASVVMLSDCDDSTTYATQVAYGLSEGSYMIMTTPAGDVINTAITNKASAGVDSYAGKLMFGDWVYWADPVNGLRLVSPQGYVAGFLSNSSPQIGSLNQPLQGIAGTQKTNANQVYAQADLQLLAQAGIDVIANPSPGGSYFSCFLGHNTSSNAVINGDSYTRLTNYIAFTLSAGMGQFVGQINNPAVQATALATLSAFFDTLWDQGLIGNPNSTQAVPYNINLSASNNPLAREALGYLQADIQVEYFPIIEKLLLNVMGGASVQITRQGVSLVS